MLTYVLTYDGGSAEIPAQDAASARVAACKELAYIGFIDEGTLSTADGRKSWDLWFDYDGHRGGIYDWWYSENGGPEKQVRPYTRPGAGTLGADGWQGLWLMTDGSIADAQWGDTDSETTLYAIGTVYGDVYEPGGGGDDDLFFPFDEVDTIDDVYCSAVLYRGFERLLIPVKSPDYRKAVDMLEDGATPAEVCRMFGIAIGGSGSHEPKSSSDKRGKGKKTSKGTKKSSSGSKRAGPQKRSRR